MDNIQPQIAIILVNYNNYQNTIDCLSSINKIKYENYYVIIVDNDSTNNSVEVLNQYKNEKVYICQSGNNGGFAYGNNCGIEFATSIGFDYVLLLNNDTLVDEWFLNRLVYSECDDPSIGIKTSKIMFYPDIEKIWYAGGTIDWNNLRATHFGYMQSDSSEFNKEKIVEFASGCCMLISKDVLIKVGKLPEEYFMYYEDLDYCVNILEKNYKILFVPDSIIYHCVSSASGGESSPFVIEWEARSRRRFCEKYSYRISNIKKNIIILKCECRDIIKIVLGKNRHKKLKAYFASYKTKI